MKFHYVFSELPYAMALYDIYLMSRCSYCADDASDGVRARRVCAGCSRVVYCNYVCLNNDLDNHRAECQAFKRRRRMENKNDVDCDVRMVGRMVARYRSDKGVASLSTDFPSHLIKDRCFDDLMTHKRDLRGSRTHMKWFNQTMLMFYEFFADTELASTSVAVMEKFYWRECINSFALYLFVKPDPNAYTTLGISLYLNVSRFNHSCSPNAQYRFESSRIVIECLRDDKTDAGVIAAAESTATATSTTPVPLRLSKQQLENLLISYGASSTFSCESAEQRIKSLKHRYFFTCRCSLCSNRYMRRLEMNAAPIQCSKCQTPYVWNKSRVFGTLRLKRICKCKRKHGANEKTLKPAAMFGSVAADDLKMLVTRWSKVSEPSKGGYEAFKTSYIQLQKLAEKYWHPRQNIRRGQINELIFTILKTWFVKEDGVFRGSDAVLNSLVNAGEEAMNAYSSYFSTYASNMVYLALDLANLYKTRVYYGDDLVREGDHERMEHWYKFVLDEWQHWGNDGSFAVIKEQADSMDTPGFVVANREEPIAEGHHGGEGETSQQ